MKAICVHYSEERKDCIIGRFPPCCKCPAFYQRAANETEEKLNDLANAIQKNYRAFARWRSDCNGYSLMVDLPCNFRMDFAIDETAMRQNWKKYKSMVIKKVKENFLEGVLLK